MSVVARLPLKRVMSFSATVAVSELMTSYGSYQDRGCCLCFNWDLSQAFKYEI